MLVAWKQYWSMINILQMAASTGIRNCNLPITSAGLYHWAIHILRSILSHTCSLWIPREDNKIASFLCLVHVISSCRVFRHVYITRFYLGWPCPTLSFSETTQPWSSLHFFLSVQHNVLVNFFVGDDCSCWRWSEEWRAQTSRHVCSDPHVPWRWTGLYLGKWFKACVLTTFVSDAMEHKVPSYGWKTKSCCSPSMFWM